MAPPPLKTDDVEVPTTDYNQVVTPTSTAKTSNDYKKDQDTNDHSSETKDGEPIETPYGQGSARSGFVMSGIGGALFPCMALVFGDAINAFAQIDGGVDRYAVNSAALDFFFISIALFVTDYSSGVLFAYTAERQMKELRTEVLKHLLYLDIGWYDKIDPLQLSSRMTGDTVKIKDGMGQKFGDAVRFICQFFSGYIIGLVRGWDIALLMSCLMPFMAGSMGVLLKIMQKRAVHSQQMYAEAGAVAEETLGSIRTVSSLNAEKRAIDKYNERALAAEETNIQVGKLSSIAFGFFMCCVWLMYAVGLWYGGSKVARDKTSPSDVFQAFFGVLLGTLSLDLQDPDTPSAIDASNEDLGDKPDFCIGNIQAVGSTDVQILNDYNVTIEPGQTVAFVGASGGGKSTLISLLERFYDPQEGTILLDDRSRISRACAVRHYHLENIAAGGNGISRDQVVAAAKLANAHNFIMTLPEQYDTLVGEKGVSLSGGQKQRVAIARALYVNRRFWYWTKRRVHLMRRASAWYKRFERFDGQDSMTTLIVVVNAGHVVEEGNHDQLVVIEDGIYRKLYTIQEEKAQEEAEAATTSVETNDEDSQPELEMESHADEPTSKFTIFDAIAFSRPERKTFIVGIIASGIMGCALPLSAVLISELNIGFFDEKKNATGALTADLSTSATKVALISGDSQGRVVQVIFTFAAALVVSFAFGSWLLTLVMLAVFPFLIMGQAARGKHMKTAGGLSDELSVSVPKLPKRLVTSKSLTGKLSDLLEEPLARGRREAHVNGLALGFGSFVLFAAYALAFWYGGKLVDDGDISFKELMRTLMAIMMDFDLLFLKVQLSFKNVSFRYPTRPEITVLKNYNLTIEAGQTVAFCGPSGGGKSTGVSLIEGSTTLLKDKYCWTELTRKSSTSIGCKPTQQEIEEAAKMANAHGFITKFPDGYERRWQRIAIARAILKNPNILLLDEATSALDSESEKVVALKRRTTIIIAHRLSTIRKADKICVVSGGKIAEQATTKN
ncbi:P-loop containing nucleoside triphosphate hydrolase [Phytophthora cactorum]|nr:P-loop containing nucleoside triphosphate hydrolase [Phytophthora cactorum]